MRTTTTQFDDLLRSLEAARSSDDDLHRQNASLAERSASHDTLLALRAEMAAARADFMRGTLGARSDA